MYPHPPFPTWKLRTHSAISLSKMYGTEVPAYTTLVNATAQVNTTVLHRDGTSTAQRPGTPTELHQVAQIFAAFGMHPTGFYDLRDASASSIPVVSTAFRPVDPGELARNPFRVFTSVLVADDRRFFDAELQRRIEEFLARRTLFPPELLYLAEQAEREQGLPEAEALRFLTLATAAFELSPEPVDRAWYATLEKVSSVAADIAGVGSTHINHLTPRVLDIDELYRRMADRGIAMIDEIQGPPRWDGPDILLRQTSFKALSEPRRFREPDGGVTPGALRVRFGEVEARGIALTPAGRVRYDQLTAEVDELLAADPSLPRQEAARTVWTRRLPATEAELARQDLAFFTYEAADRPADGRHPPHDLPALLDGGPPPAHPVVHEDFLPRPAAGIFRSNLDDEGSKDAGQTASPRDTDWLAAVLDRPVHDPAEHYARQRRTSLDEAAKALGIAPVRPTPGEDPA
ncbi:protein of unknown function DUF1338 [Actinobacteria bacterium OK074]|nr:protein of unknown function DUF1338 [Actinobacteria bacterium OK074]